MWRKREIREEREGWGRGLELSANLVWCKHAKFINGKDFTKAAFESFQLLNDAFLQHEARAQLQEFLSIISRQQALAPTRTK